MKVKFLSNLGLRDAAEMEVDARQCVVGAVIDVDDAVGTMLVSRGICDVVKGVAKQAKIRGVKEGEQSLKNYKEKEVNKE